MCVDLEIVILHWYCIAGSTWKKKMIEVEKTRSEELLRMQEDLRKEREVYRKERELVDAPAPY